MIGHVEVRGLKELRAALKATQASAPREITRTIRAAGEPILQQARATTPVGTETYPSDPHPPGSLAAGYQIRARGTTGSIVSRVPYAPGATWGQRGKWRGFARYGARPRLAGQALVDQAPAVQAILTEGLEDILTVRGWFRGRV